jgi:hypothetical protein
MERRNRDKTTTRHTPTVDPVSRLLERALTSRR